MTTIDTRAPLHSTHVKAAIIALDKGHTMKSIKETLSGYAKPLEGANWQQVCRFWFDANDATRKQDFRDHLCNLHFNLCKREEAPAVPAPEITAEQREDHLQTAEALTGILKAHDIDPQDWDAVMDYLFSTQGHPLKYMVKIYVDYIHGTASDLGYTLANPEHVAQWDCPALVQDEYEGWQEIRTEQEARAVLTRACNNWVSQSNRLPRGNCALRMLSLGWTFNH